mgnify:CR=1 FL=1|uniref:Uncharacterized protein n=1 Tax=Haptolina ericina TaxID=156174 RepID=A0A7S3B501_9EUKA|mmetsp:Transcript_48084/g.108319  ORF Transcript_48084/g.108319 Transcript_48084/m.108319 type:complete len:120 (+) Transcript_48084:31-390(+)
MLRLILALMLLQVVAALQLSPALRPAAIQRPMMRHAMQAEGEPVVKAEDAAEGVAEDGADFYDDDKPIIEKPPVSNAMRERLINEARGVGADPNSKSPFLPVFFGVGVFVVLGALAVNM